MNKNKHIVSGKFIILILLFFILIACKQHPEVSDELVAQVNDRYLLINQLNYLVPENMDPELTLALKKNLISKWVDNEVLYQAALDEGLTLDERESFLLENYKKSFLIQKYIASKVNRNYRISQKEIEDYYKEHHKEFVHKNDVVRIVHLLMEQKDNAIFKEIHESKNLNEIIKKYYFDEKSTTERPNGDLGYIPIENLPENFQKVIRRMKTGAISNPISSDQGYHFIQLLDRQSKGNQKDLELVQDEIKLRLKKERRETELDRLLKDLKEKSQIQTYLSKVQN
ncbi:MAG: peptidyl-prolyl cis-trans isomerase [Calditrichaceae bacterium]|jgi:EpsD family peptidyl-prolyl cis-trans isomerase